VGSYRTDPLARLAKRMTQQPDGCWTVKATANGYGSVQVGPRKMPAHVLVYQQTSPLSTEGLHVHHMCETPNCINPGHLALLTPRQHVNVHRYGHPDYFDLDNDNDRERTDFYKALAWQIAHGTGKAYVGEQQLTG
jgi:hypothetical protein